MLSTCIAEHPYLDTSSTMTDTIPVAPTSPKSRQIPRGGRRRGGSGQENSGFRNGNQRAHDLRGGRGDRTGRNRGRGDLGHSSSMPDAHFRTSSGQRPNNPFDGSRIDDPANAERLDSSQTSSHDVGQPKNPIEEGEVCFICASSIEHLSIAPCNHQTCHICALRLRALYKKRDCAYCKVSNVKFRPYVK